LIDQCLGDWEHCSFQPNELTVSSCSLEPNVLKELVVQHINPNLQQSSNGYVMMGFCLWMWGLGFYFINVQNIQLVVHVNSSKSSFIYLPSWHNEPHKLIITHEFNLDIYNMIFHWYYVDHCANFKVLFYQHSRDLNHYSLEPNELTISCGCWFEPNEPKELVVQHTNLDNHQLNQVIISSTYSFEHNTHNELTIIHMPRILNIVS
jgi:hypothetical protein